VTAVAALTSSDPAVDEPLAAGPVRHRDWDVVVAHAPLLAVTAWRYLDQLAVSMRPATVDVADNTLRCFAGFLVTEHPDLVGFVDVRRAHVEGFKLFFVARLTAAGKLPARNTIRQRFGMLRSFFDRIIEWDWDDAPMRIPIFSVDVPIADDPLPRFLDDVQAARLAAAAAVAAPFDRLIIELLSRTGMRVGELCTLERDAVVELNGTPWIRVPVGKLHNDRYVPLHPNAARLLADWVALHPPSGGLLLEHQGRCLDRHHVGRIVKRVAVAAGLEHVHPHQLAPHARHPGDQPWNATRSDRHHARASQPAASPTRPSPTNTPPPRPRSTLSTPPPIQSNDSNNSPASTAGLLANGWCNRHVATDCVYETICEGCGDYQTTIEFRPTLQAQADHATRNHQTERAAIYNRLLGALPAESA
jgi:integrase